MTIERKPLGSTSKRYRQFMTDAQLANYSKRWALHLGRKWGLARHEIDELAQEASIAIIHAGDKYNAAKGRAFLGYAFQWAMAIMTRHANTEFGPVRLPSSSTKRNLGIRLVSQDESKAYQRGSNHHVDERTVLGNQESALLAREVLEIADDRTACILRAKMYDYTNKEAGEALGISGERTRVLLGRLVEQLEGEA